MRKSVLRLLIVPALLLCTLAYAKNVYLLGHHPVFIAELDSVVYSDSTQKVKTVSFRYLFEGRKMRCGSKGHGGSLPERWQRECLDL
jgi:hypothetical protein